MKNMIVFVVQQQCSNYPKSFWGLGDILKGIVTSFQYAKRKRMEFLIDFHLHPIGKYYADGGKTEYSERIDEQAVPFRHVLHGCENEGPPVFIFTNGAAECRLPLKEDERRLLISVLQPFVDYTTPLREKIFHFRFGDDCMFKNDACDFDKALQILDESKPGDGVCSDSRAFNEMIFIQRPDLHVSPATPTHIGLEKDEDKFLSTMNDVNMLIHAGKIISTSVYGWNSGFAFWIAEAFGIPFESRAFS